RWRRAQGFARGVRTGARPGAHLLRRPARSTQGLGASAPGAASVPGATAPGARRRSGERLKTMVGRLEAQSATRVAKGDVMSWRSLLRRDAPALHHTRAELGLRLTLRKGDTIVRRDDGGQSRIIREAGE